MQRIIFFIALAMLAAVDSKAQFELMPEVSNSDYGLIRTNLTFGYDHTFGSVPDNVTGRVSYQIVNKQWLKFSANARFNTIWSNFEDSQLKVPDKDAPVEEPLDAWGIGMNGNHVYGSVGFTAMGFVPLFGHPLAVVAMGNVEWSSHCFGRWSGAIGGIYLFKVTKDTQFGVGPVFLLHTSSKIPVLPFIVYRHRFSEKVALNIYGGLFGVEVAMSPKDHLVAGADIDVRSFYFKPGIEGWPATTRFTMALFRPNIKYRRKLFPNFYGELEAGVAFKISGRITGAAGTREYLQFTEKPAFFVKAGLSYSL